MPVSTIFYWLLLFRSLCNRFTSWFSFGLLESPLAEPPTPSFYPLEVLMYPQVQMFLPSFIVEEAVLVPSCDVFAPDPTTVAADFDCICWRSLCSSGSSGSLDRTLMLQFYVWKM